MPGFGDNIGLTGSFFPMVSMKHTQQHRISEEIGWILGFLALIWLIFIADGFLPLERYGLIPRHAGGLIGIASMHFLHSSLGHLLANTIPLMVLLILLAGSRGNSVFIVISICLIGGTILWLVGRSSIHIGASLLVFGLASFLIVSGFIEKRAVPLLISVLVIAAYGASLLEGILPFQKGVSIEGHLSGLIAGAISAFLIIPRTGHE